MALALFKLTAGMNVPSFFLKERFMEKCKSHTVYRRIRGGKFSDVDAFQIKFPI